MVHQFMDWEEKIMAQALRLAERARGFTSPNPMVGAVICRGQRVVARGFHQGAGFPHAEEEAIFAAKKKRTNLSGCTLYVTLEPCSTHGRRPPCTDLIIRSGLREVVAGATDPNPAHAGRGFAILKRAGVKVRSGLRAEEAARLNESFNYWIVNRRPWITLKLAMTMDGKIAGGLGRSKWITGARSRRQTMGLRQGADAILVGANTVLADDPSLTLRGAVIDAALEGREKILARIVLDPRGKVSPQAKVFQQTAATPSCLVCETSQAARVGRSHPRIRVLPIRMRKGSLDLVALMKLLGAEGVTHLLVEGGGETTAAFLNQGLGNRVAFFYAPKLIPHQKARKAVGGDDSFPSPIRLQQVSWSQLGPDWFLTGLLPGKR